VLLSKRDLVHSSFCNIPVLHSPGIILSFNYCRHSYRAQLTPISTYYSTPVTFAARQELFNLVLWQRMTLEQNITWRVGQPSELIFRVPDPLVFKGPCFRPFLI
jgi:hypothetical protein